MVPWFAKTHSPTHHHTQVREKKHAFTLLSNEHLLEPYRSFRDPEGKVWTKDQINSLMSAKFRFIIIF